jgi:ketosteroid isomerase-like protein
MAAEDVARLKRAFAAFAEGDLETALSFVDPSFEIEDRVISSPPGRGPEALIQNAAQVREVFGDVSWEPMEIIDLGDRLLVRVHVTGTGDHTSLPIDEDVGHIYAFKGGKATKLDIFRTWDEAKAQAGVEAERRS